MSLNKAIEHGKEHRKPYTGGKSISKNCRNHGSCDWCLGNRLHKYNKKLAGKQIQEEI
jgi:hypothetical protein